MHLPATTGLFRHPNREGTSVQAALAAALYIILYVLLDWLSYLQPVLKFGVTPWNPQAGLTLAVLILFGPRVLIATAVAALLAEAIVRGSPAPWPALLIVSAWIAIGYGVLAAALRRWGLQEPIRAPVAAARMAAAAAMMTGVVATGYVAVFYLAGSFGREVIADNIARYWVGDLNGILTLTPLLLYGGSWRAGAQAVKQRRWEVLAQLFAVALTVWMIFGLAASNELRFFYPLFVPVIWIALRWGVPGAVLAALAIQIGLLIAARDESRAPPYFELQFLMLTLSVTALLLGAAVTERADALRRVARRESEQRTLLATAPDAVLTVDPEGRVQSTNPAATRLFGEMAPGARRLSELLPAIQLNGREGRASLEGCRTGGRTFPAEAAWAQFDAAANQGFLVMVRDATDRRRAEAQLRERDTALARAMRFAVAGELASALAHELNQPITALVSYLRASEILAAPIANQDARLPGTLGKAAQEAMRASEVLRRLRDFYRGGTLKRDVVNLPTLCASVAAAFQERLRRAGAQLTLRMAASLPALEADATQLEIVLHNLVSNAVDAVLQVAPAARRIEIGAEYIAGDVVVYVEDSGCGVSAEVADRLFEPFVTSKPDGMGLGLVISRSLLRARGGDLALEPARELGGARFVLRIPVHVSQEAFA